MMDVESMYDDNMTTIISMPNSFVGGESNAVNYISLNRLHFTH